MARDCYKAVFKITYAQAKADGLSDAAAYTAAQAAMQQCLQKQANQIPTVQPYVPIPGGILPDPGPVHGGSGDGMANRSSALGTRKK